MTATLGAGAISTATVRLPRYGAWSADVTLTDDTALTVPSQQTLTVGDLSLLGTVTSGGDFGGQARYTVVGGAGTWNAQIRTLPYHDDNGVMLSRVLADLAKDAKEIGAILDGIPDRSLGQDWTRPAGLASDQLDALSGGQWWINASDGVTHVGVRPTSATSPSTLTVGEYDGEMLRAVVQLSDDTISSLLPGATLAAQGLPAPLAIVRMTVRVDGASISAELWGETSDAELLRRIVAHLTAGTLFHRVMPYAVASVASDGRVAVQPADGRSTAFPDAPLLAHIPGLPGASVTLARGARVLVAYVAGDPGSPAVVGYFPDVAPATIGLTASTSVSISAPQVNVGGSNPLCDGGIQFVNNAIIGAALTALGHPVTLTDPRTTITRGA